MGRIIEGQIIAGSGPDREGNGIDQEVIRRLFDQIHEQGVGGVDHDLSRSPIVRAFNYKLVETNKGEVQIKADIEVLDEAEFSKMGGFSIAFLGKTHRIGTADTPAMQILLNPAQFDMSNAKVAIDSIMPDGYAIALREKIEKALLLGTAIVIISFVVGGIFQGFLSAAGADLYKWFKGLVRKDDPDAPVELQLRFKSPFPVILRVSSDLTSEEFSQIQVTNLQLVIPDDIGTQEIARVVGTIGKGPTVVPHLVVLRNGMNLQLADSEPSKGKV